MKRDEDRMYKVLFAAVREFIKTKRPVSSKRILQVTNMPWSGATIRNDMRRLEEMGYLYQPHTSAGRIPTDKGLRFYLEEIKDMRDLFREESLGIETYQRFPMGDLETILDAVAKVLSKATSGVAIIERPSFGNLKLLKTHVIPFGEDQAIIAVITDLGLSRVVPISRIDGLNMKALERLFDLFVGMSLSEIMEGFEKYKPSSGDQAMILEVAKGVLRFIIGTPRIVYKGLYEVLREHGQDIEKLVMVLESSAGLERVFRSVERGVRVFVGEENPMKELRSFSTFVAPYFKGEDLVGHIGLITGKFVEYERILPIMEFVSSRLTEYLTVTTRR